MFFLFLVQEKSPQQNRSVKESPQEKSPQISPVEKTPQPVLQPVEKSPHPFGGHVEKRPQFYKKPSNKFRLTFSNNCEAILLLTLIVSHPYSSGKFN